MVFQSIQLNNGKVFKGEKIGELVSEIINKFSEAGLSSSIFEFCRKVTKEIIMAMRAVKDDAIIPKI